jgi:hypothetical protein
MWTSPPQLSKPLVGVTAQVKRVRTTVTPRRIKKDDGGLGRWVLANPPQKPPWIDGKDVELTAADLIKMREKEANQQVAADR